MIKTIFLLMIISAAISAYARGRREGTWSWRLFAKTLLGLWVLCAVVAALGVWLGRIMGPEHALLATVLLVIVIGIGVFCLTLWVRRKTGNQNL